MELVYLWVEKYKNIENQGFNFSPRYKCNYEKNELIIVDKEETKEPYLKNFFGENINITAIVGENGSGKSSVLSSILSHQRIFIVIFDQELKVYTRNISVKTNLPIIRLTSSMMRNIMYSSMDNTFLRATNKNVKHIILEETNKLITENYARLNELDFNIFNFKPAYIQYELNDFRLINEDYDIDESDIYRINSALDRDFSSASDTIMDALIALKNIGDEYINYLLYQFGDIVSLFENIDLTEKLHPKDNSLFLKISEVQEKLKICEISFLSESEFQLLKDNENQKIRIDELENIFGNNYIELLFIHMDNEIDFNYFSLNDASFNSLSHGEKTIYSFMLNILDFNSREYLLFLDEPDNTLHPDWQKRFLNELIKFIKKLEKKVHIIITSHSPHLLSDMPKQNVLFLEKDGNTGLCINVSDKIDINPFGANIHTLLSHGFFMRDGLMGEFAKGKINNIIQNLNDSEYNPDPDEKRKVLQIIKSIGEDFLKSKLLNMYYKKFDDVFIKEQRKKELIEQQKHIEKELAKLQ